MHARRSSRCGWRDLRQPNTLREYDSTNEGPHRLHGATLAERRDGGKASGGFYLDGFDAWRPGDHVAHDDGSAAAPGNVDRRRALLAAWNDSYGSEGRDTLRYHHNCRSTRRTAADARGSSDSQGTG